MLVTVVTPCFNSAQHLEDTILSVLNQTYTSIEYIVMDGGSTDGTLDILRRYADRLTYVSEPDRGQSHAINKGWHMAKGEILAWLNADDQYVPNTVQCAVEYLTANQDVAWIYGLPEMLDPAGHPFPFRHPIAQHWDYLRLLNRHNYVCQPTVFLRRSVVKEYGYLREDLHYVMDYEYWLRIGQKYPGRLVPSVCARVKMYRETKTSSGGLKRLQEIDTLLRSYGGQGVPTGMRHEWVEAHLMDALAQVQQGHWSEALQSLGALKRFPASLPRGVAKAVLRQLPLTWEARLRRWILRRDRYPD